MKIKKRILLLTLFLLPSQNIYAIQQFCCDGCTFLCGKSFFPIRSQNTNTARRSVGNHSLKFRNDVEKTNGVFTLTPEYMQSFAPRNIAQYFFATDIIRFSGSQVENRGDCDILADYFGLSTTFDGVAKFKPQIKTFLLDIDFFLGLDRLTKGLYFEFFAPLVTTQWSMCVCEDVANNGSDTPYPAGYMSPESIAAPSCSIAKSLRGNVSFGDIKQGIRFGKFCGNGIRETKLADITLVLGYLLVNRERGYAGFNLRGTIPTGTRPASIYIFEPIAGNGRHAEAGVGFVGQIDLWQKDGDQRLAMHVDINFTHLFRTRQCRSFDFCNKCLSRYTLLKCFDENGGYSGVTVPAINVTTLPCKVRVDFQADINIMFAYLKKDWEFDFGYNAWLRSHERICLCDCNAIPPQRYALKGIQDVSNLAVNDTQSNATIHGNYLSDQSEVADQNPPVFISSADLDICSASGPLAFTHKFYWHLSRAWGKMEDKRVVPFLGIGGQIEFESEKPRDTYPYQNTLYQWGLWLKGGFAFN